MGRLCYPTRAPAGSRYFSQKAVTVQGGYGALFAVMVQILLSIMRVAVQVWSEPVNYHDTGYLMGALAPLKRGYNLSQRQKSVTVQDFSCG
jgi:hypothetical protein